MVTSCHAFSRWSFSESELPLIDNAFLKNARAIQLIGSEINLSNKVWQYIYIYIYMYVYIEIFSISSEKAWVYEIWQE